MGHMDFFKGLYNFLKYSIISLYVCTCNFLGRRSIDLIMSSKVSGPPRRATDLDSSAHLETKSEENIN